MAGEAGCSKDSSATWVSDVIGKEKEQTAVMRALKKLVFVNPGEAAVLPVSDRSGTRRREHQLRGSMKDANSVFDDDDESGYYPHHDSEGYFILPDGGKIQLCDCLRVDCHGCFLPCTACGSRMCGKFCRKNREFTVESIRFDSGQCIMHPYLEIRNKLNDERGDDADDEE
ncbi:hypothetical protein AB6A40_003784 [Gnathostoma spinigerum]|uniref:ARF7 effector protein C-terminal domain-containing protein n=1 Tax=Gnathostoma spinigerum TaxID=75299 RepID=A0ABD6EAL2_9BILA